MHSHWPSNQKDQVSWRGQNRYRIGKADKKEVRAAGFVSCNNLVLHFKIK